MIGRYTRMDSTNAPVDLYGNGQLNGDPYSPEHFITTQAMLASTWTINSTTVFDARVGFLRWDYDREPGNLGINLTQQFGFAQTPYGEISERSGIPGMETIPSIAVTNNNTINTGLIYADDRTYTFTPTLTKIKGDHTIKVGANLLRGEVNYFQNNNPGGTFTFTNAPTALDGTNPGSTGDGFAAFLLGLPTAGTYQSSSYTYGRSTYQAYFAEDSWQVNGKLTVNLGLRWEIPGVFTEKDDNLSTFNPDVVNPLLTGITNPVTGQPFLGAFELVNTDRAARAWHAEEPARSGRASPRLRVSAHPQHGDPRWRRQVHRPLDGAVPRRPDRTRHQPARQQHPDQRRQQPDLHRRPDQPVPERRAELPRPQPTTSSRRCWAAAPTSSSTTPTVTLVPRISGTSRCSTSSATACRWRPPTWASTATIWRTPSTTTSSGWSTSTAPPPTRRCAA